MQSDIETAFAIIAAHPELARFHGAKSPRLLESAEARLGVSFPYSYRIFLIQYGCGGFAGREFYGLLDDDFECSAVPNAIWLTLNFRKTANLPNSLIVVYGVGDDTYYALDTSKMNADRECPVVEWCPGLPADGLTSPTRWQDFGSLFLEKIRHGLAVRLRRDDRR